MKPGMQADKQTSYTASVKIIFLPGPKAKSRSQRNGFELACRNFYLQLAQVQFEPQLQLVQVQFGFRHFSF
jgi:hypothetical protein